jgi:hydroxymethylpyrimidine/phosphomethylpyrimidine kinase
VPSCGPSLKRPVLIALVLNNDIRVSTILVCVGIKVITAVVINNHIQEYNAMWSVRSQLTEENIASIFRVEE